MSDFIDPQDMPQPPSAMPAGENAAADASFDSSASMDDFKDVPKMGEAMPMGTYHFRLEKVTKGAGENHDPKKGEQPMKYGDGTDVGPLPYYMVEWICQQEPYVGRRFGDFAPWVPAGCFGKAKSGDQVARTLLKDRLWKIKAIMESCNFAPPAGFNVETDFFAQHPECKIQLGTQPGKAKNAEGKYVEDGSQKNKSIRYIPLNRPA